MNPATGVTVVTRAMEATEVAVAAIHAPEAVPTAVQEIATDAQAHASLQTVRICSH